MAETTIAKNVRVGGYIMLDGAPCRVISVSLSKTGRHGHAKARIEAIGLFDEKKRIVLKHGDAQMEIPMIIKGTAQVISVSGDIAQLMDMQDYSTFEASVPDELRDKLDAGIEIHYWKIGSSITIKGIKG